MRIIYASPNNGAGPARVWSAMVKLAVLIMTVAVLLGITLIGLFVVLPLFFFAGVALHIYLRYRLRHARRRQPQDGVIDAEYRVVEQR